MPYGNQDGPSMESAKQEKYDLLHDNPVAKDASGGRPWIAKHFKSSMSPLKDMHSNSPAEKELVGNQKNLNPGLRAAIEAAPEMKEGMHMNYDGVSKKYPAAVHQNEKVKEAAMEIAKKAGEEGVNEISEQLSKNAGKAGAKVVNKVKKKNK